MIIKVIKPFSDETGEHVVGETISGSPIQLKRLLFLGYVTQEKDIDYGKKQRKASEDK